MRDAGDLRIGEQPPAYGNGGNRPALGAASSARPRAERTRQADATGADLPRPFPAEALALVVMHSPRLTRSVFGALRLLPVSARAEARRWRAGGAPLKL